MRNTHYNYYFDIHFCPVTIFWFTETDLGQHSVLNLYILMCRISCIVSCVIDPNKYTFTYIQTLLFQIAHLNDFWQPFWSLVLLFIIVIYYTISCLWIDVVLIQVLIGFCPESFLTFYAISFMPISRIYWILEYAVSFSSLGTTESCGRLPCARLCWVQSCVDCATTTHACV